MTDQERGKEIAETARLFFLWLRVNVLPNFEYFRDLEQFDVYAGVFREYDKHPSPVFPQLDADPNTPDNRILRGLGSLKYRILYTNRFPLDGLQAQTMNMLVPVRAGADLELEGALIVHNPRLDTIPPAALSDEDFETVHLWLIQNRTDMVWDSASEAKARGFVYSNLLDFEPPRDGFNRNLTKILPPAALLERLPRNSHDKVLRLRQDRFYDYLYNHATYTERRRAQDDSDYYTKWKSKFPSEAKDREPRPSKMHPDFLKRNYNQIPLKKGETYLLLEDEFNLALQWLRVEHRPGGRKDIKPQLLYLAAKKPKTSTPNQARVIFFHALDGGASQYQFSRGKRPELTATKRRYVVDYKAVVRSFSGGSPPDLRKDEEWLARFVSILFPDATVTAPILRQYPNAPVNRDELFLTDLRAARDAADEPIKSTLTATVAELEAKKELVMLTQGMTLPGGKQFIGLDEKYNLYEWDRETAQVTRIEWGEFTSQQGFNSLAMRVFENTQGMIPVIKVIVWAGVAVMGGGLMGGGPGAARLLATDWVRGKVTSKAAKEALDRLKPQILATIVNAIMTLLPRSDSLFQYFFHGFLQGLGAGSIETYILEADERLERTAIKVADRVTRNAYKVYRYTHRLVSDTHKIASLISAIYNVWSNKLALALAELLKQFSTRLAAGFLILLVLILYLDYAYVRGAIPKIITEREWKRMQKRWINAAFSEMRDIFHIDAIKLRTPPPLVDGMLPYDPNAVKRLVATAKKEGKGSAIEAILADILLHLGIPSWEKIKALDPWELIEAGLDNFVARHPNLAKEEVYALGEAVGSLAGLMLLERSVLNSDKRKQWTEKMPAYSKEVQTALSEGTPRALLRFLKFPLERILKRVKELPTAVTLPAPSTAQFTRQSRVRRFGLAALRAAVREELRDLSATLIALAADPELEAELTAVAAGGGDQDLPSLDELAGKSAVPNRKAVLFALAHMLRLALSEIDQAFELLENGQSLGGHLTLGKLLDIFRFEEDSIENIKVFQ